jgi:hypothetical protein
MRNRRETIGDVGLYHPTPVLVGLVDDDLQGVVRSPLGPKPERAGKHVRLEDRFQHDLQSSLHDTVADRRNRERSLLQPTGLRDVHPPGRHRLERLGPQLRGQLVEQTVNAVFLDLFDGDLVDARCAVISAHQPPRPLQDVPAVDLVIERMEPSPGIGLGRPVKLALQGADRIEILDTWGGTSHGGTHRPSPLTHAWTK